MSDEKQEKQEVACLDPALIAAGLTIAMRTVDLIARYSDENMVAPTKEAVRLHLEGFMASADLPEKFDEGLVNAVMDKFQSIFKK